MESATELEVEAPHKTGSRTFHPLFSSQDGDVVLAAKGGVLFFHVHSFTLKTTSGFFRTMYTLPQKCAPSPDEVVYMDEDVYTLEGLLRMVCGLPLPPIDTYDQIDSLLFAAEKYDMPGPLSILRLQVMTPLFLEEPFRLYTAACRYGWEAEAKFSSTRTLTCNLHDPAIRPSLQRLSTEAVLNLFELHRSRREGLRERLNDPPFVPGGSAPCVQCHATLDYHTWRELKYKIILEMDVRPLGDTIVDGGLVDWPEAHACWESKCRCGRLLYDQGETLRVIRDCIDKLAKSI